jgi:hypothetical protein
VLPVVWLVVAVVAAVLVTMWVTFTLTRLDRLHARVDAAQAALDAQLVRRAAALQHVAERPDSGAPAERRQEFDAVAQEALASHHADGGREPVENAVGRAIHELVAAALLPEATAELQEAATRVRIARGFYNDAVRDTRALRERRLPRIFHMAGRRVMPEFFDIDDTLPDMRPEFSADSAHPVGGSAESAAGDVIPTEQDRS